MTDREALLAHALIGTPWENWRWESIGADASSRRYFRLIGPSNETVVLVDVPPEHENYRHFLNVAKTLSNVGLSVPKPSMEDHDTGIFVISDLGPETVAAAKSRGVAGEREVEDVIIDVLVTLRGVEYSGGAILDKNTATKMLHPLFDNYGASGQDQIFETMSQAFATHVADGVSFSLRDFHAENIIWRGDQRGVKKAGLLDFQDAFFAPDGYDLASYTRDVRRVMKPEEQRYMEDQLAKRLGVRADPFQLQVAILAIQRNLRILGVFARLIAQGKPRYAHFLPMTWTHILNDLKHPELHSLEDAVRTFVPDPSSKSWETK